MSWLGRLFGRKQNETPKETPPKYPWQDKKYGFSGYERHVLLKLEEITDKSADESYHWCGDTPSNRSVRCPYCKGPVIELFKRNGGFVLNVSMGLFCLRCGTELVCAVKGCRYKSGDNLIGDRSHWGGEGAGHSQYKIRRSGRNLRDIIIAKLEEQKQFEPKPVDEPLPLPEPEDEYAALEKRLDEIAERERKLEEEKDKIKHRMWEIDVAIATDMLPDIERPAGLLRAAGDDLEIVTEAEAEADRLAPAAEEGDE